MSDVDGAAPAAVPSTGELSIAEAVNYLNTPPEKRKDEPATPPPEEPRAAREKSTPDGVDDAEPEEAPGEDEATDEAEEPPVQPPKSWPKASKEAFALLPREAQQEIVDTQNKRDADYQRGLRDAAQQSKAAEAREQAAEQARVQYEAALPQLLQQFSAQFQTEFQDIKTWDDVSNLQQNDPMRFNAWQLARDKGQTLQREAHAAQERQQQQYWQRFAQWSEAEDTKSEEYLKKEHPKLDVDPKAKRSQMSLVGEGLKQMLIDDVGFADEEVTGWWAGQPMSLRDSRVQRMFIDAYAYRKAKAGVKEASETRKPVPPVQRPGTASTRGEATNVQAKILSDRLTKTGRLEDAVALLNARTARRR